MKIANEEFGTLAICAIRYCQGRQTYMPETIRGIIRPRLKSINTQDLYVMLNDCSLQKKKDLYGDSAVDKPGWIEWEHAIEEEYERRKRRRQ